MRRGVSLPNPDFRRALTADCVKVYPSAMTAAYPQTFPISQVPAGRQGTPDEIAAAVLYLVGKGGAYVTGAVQLTDGGRLCGMPSTY